MRAVRRIAAPLLCLALVCAWLPRAGICASTFSRLVPGGDLGAFGSVGPQGRSGASAVSTDDSRVLLFGGRADHLNGDYLNDLWLFDWPTGNWSAYQPASELVCDACSTCDSPLANQASGHSLQRLDDGTYARCDDPADTSWLNLSTASRAAGLRCTYTPPCLEWTGQRPYFYPQLDLGTGVVTREVPSGRYAHAAALALNRVSGERDTMVLFGGYSTDCTDYCNDTWLYSVPNNVWTQPGSMGRAPARRWKHSMSDYRDSVFLFGGHGQARASAVDASAVLPNEIYDVNDVYDPSKPLLFDDLWEYNLTRAAVAGASWSKRVTVCTTCNSSEVEADGTLTLDVRGPRPRHSASLVTYADCLYLFGGWAFGGLSSYVPYYPTRDPSSYPSLLTKYYRNDLWRFNISANTWAQIRAANASHAVPSPRAGHAAAVSARDGQAVMVIFGGNTWDDQIGDAWQFNFSSQAWMSIQGDGAFPSRRTAPILVAVGQDSRTAPGSGPQSGRLLLATGHGCLKGTSYAGAASSSVTHAVSALGAYSGYDTSLSRSGNGTISAFGSYVNATTGNVTYAVSPDLWVETSAEYGEKYCVEELDDVWEYSPSACPADCSRHGPCFFNSCICDPGFWGTDCSNVTCPASSCAYDYVRRTLACSFCNGRGSCNGLLGTCSCAFPASGAGCEAYACLNGCSGHGVCNTALANAQGYGTCACEDGYQGLDCGVTVCVLNPSEGASTESCSGQGICVGGRCACFPGFGDSILYRAVATGADTPPMQVPVFANGSDIPGCAAEGTPGCQPVYVADCGSLGYVPGAASSLRVARGLAVVLALAAVLAWC